MNPVTRRMTYGEIEDLNDTPFVIAPGDTPPQDDDSPAYVPSPQTVTVKGGEEVELTEDNIKNNRKITRAILESVLEERGVDTSEFKNKTEVQNALLDIMGLPTIKKRKRGGKRRRKTKKIKRRTKKNGRKKKKRKTRRSKTKRRKKR